MPNHSSRCASRNAGDETAFDPWRVIHRLQPPLPSCGDRYAVAIALALEGGNDDDGGEFFAMA